MEHIARIESELALMTQLPGILGCALVDSSTGLSWSQTGCVTHQPLTAEAACEYWRLYLRQRDYFADMGELRAQVVIHTQKRITISGCGLEMILIAVSDERVTVDWVSWQAHARKIKALIETL